MTTDGPTSTPDVEDLPPDDPDLAVLRRRRERPLLGVAALLALLGLALVALTALAAGPLRLASAVLAVLFLGFTAGWLVRWAGTRRHWLRAVGTVPAVRWTGTGRGSPEPTNRETVVELSAELVPVPVARYVHTELVPPRALKGPVTIEVFHLDDEGRTGGPARFTAQGQVRWAESVRLSDEDRPPRREPRRPTPDISHHV